MIFPAKIKNGIASKLNTEIPEKILWAPVTTVAWVFKIGKIARMEETPKDTAIGAPANSMTRRTVKMISPDNIAIFIRLFLLLSVLLPLNQIQDIDKTEKYDHQAAKRQYKVHIAHRDL